jgi:hypothetical protein
MEQGNTDNSDGSREARGMAGPLGLFTEPVKTFLDEPTHTAWLRLCNSKGKTSSELLRDVVYLLTHGRTPAEMSADDTRTLLTAQGLNQVRSAARTTEHG